jgi:hypothetical protein
MFLVYFNFACICNNYLFEIGCKSKILIFDEELFDAIVWLIMSKGQSVPKNKFVLSIESWIFTFILKTFFNMILHSVIFNVTAQNKH